MNVYYAGAIIVSFIGTFAIGTDYYITKQKITEGYENRIATLENEVNNLRKEEEDNHSFIKSNHKKNDKKNSHNLGNTFQDVSTGTPLLSVEESPNQLNPNTSHEDLNHTISTLGLNQTDKDRVMIEGNDETNTSIVGRRTNSGDSISLGNIKPEEIPELDTTEVVKTGQSLPVKQDPVIKYVQDTIYEIDSTKIPRWRVRKLKG